MGSLKSHGAVPVRWHTGSLGNDLGDGSFQARPRNPVSETPLAALVDIESLASLLDDFSALVGMTTALLDLEGNILQSAGWQKACTGFHRAVPGSCANCTESDLFLARHLRKGEFVDYKCKNGLWDVVTPVFVGDRHLGNLYCGQFFYDDDEVDEAFFAAQANRHGYDPEAYLAAIRGIPRFSRQRVRHAMGFMANLASYLSNLSLTNLRLRESQGQTEALINALPDPVWLKDTEGVYVACNRALEAMLGAPAADILGKSDFDLFPRDQAESFRRHDLAAIAAGRPCCNEESLVDAGSGRTVFMETVKAPVPGVAGKGTGVLGIARNITARKKAEAEIQRLNTELEERVQKRTAELEQSNEALMRSNMELQRFAHAAAHDLQTPLRSIVGFTQLLQRQLRGHLEAPADEWLALVIDNTKRLQTLIEELLAYSRLDAQARPLEAVDLGEVIDEVVKTLATPIREARALVGSGELPTLMADRTQMAQLLQNLIENGIKYNRATPPRVVVTAERRDREWVIAVADNGIGIEPRYHKRIFEMFRRLHAHQEFPGTGIGLAICQRIVERHGGRLWVESEAGKGSVFRFSLPAEAAEAPIPTGNPPA